MIELKQIRKDYGECTVIKNQSLSIKDKEFFVLIGPSGSGKTTLLKLINRLIDPTEGDVLLDGKSVMDYPLRELRLNTGYVLQQIALFPNLTVAENIELVPIMKKWPKQIRKEQTTQLLSKVGLDPKIYAICGEIIFNSLKQYYEKKTAFPPTNRNPSPIMDYHLLYYSNRKRTY